ncbi:unnamed protein product [Sphagnum balticum]
MPRGKVLRDSSEAKGAEPQPYTPIRIVLQQTRNRPDQAARATDGRLSRVQGIRSIPRFSCAVASINQRVLGASVPRGKFFADRERYVFVFSPNMLRQRMIDLRFAVYPWKKQYRLLADRLRELRPLEFSICENLGRTHKHLQEEMLAAIE